MVIKNIHEKLLNGIQQMLIDTKINLPYYGEFNLHVSFHEQDSIGTCAVNMTPKGMNFYYSPKFLADMSQKEVNFITLHEDFHLLFNHPKRTVSGQYDHAKMLLSCSKCLLRICALTKTLRLKTALTHCGL